MAGIVGGLVRLPDSVIRFELAEPFLEDRDLGIWFDLKPLKDGNWLVIGRRAGGALGTLSKLHPDGTLDEDFNPKHSHYFDSVSTDNGTFYVLRYRGGQKEIIHLLEDGSLDPAFTPFRLPETSPRRWEIQAMAFDPSTGGFFVGAGRERSPFASALTE